MFFASFICNAYILIANYTATNNNYRKGSSQFGVKQGAHETSRFNKVKNLHAFERPIIDINLHSQIFKNFHLLCYKTEIVYLPTFPLPSGKCSTTHP